MWIFGRKGVLSSSTAEEVARGIDGSTLTAIVTGANSGIGAETARVLALCGVHVIMAVRNVESGESVKDTIIKDNPEAKIDVMELDLASFASIRKFALDYDSSGLPLNILMGHFLLTNLLLDNMKKTASESQKEGRIVNVSSAGHWLVSREGFRFDKFNDSSSRFFSILGYAKSKLANILHANELARRFKEAGVEITANSLHPGAVTTNIVRYNGLFQGLLDKFGAYFCKDIPQGAATTCYVALHPQVQGVSGKYFSDCDVSRPSRLAVDAELGKKLWDFSLNMTESTHQ